MKPKENQRKTRGKPPRKTTRFVWGKGFATKGKPEENHSGKPPDLCGGKDLQPGGKPEENQRKTTQENHPICVGEKTPTSNLTSKNYKEDRRKTRGKPLRKTTRFVWGKRSGRRSAHRLGFIIIKTNWMGGFCAPEALLATAESLQYYITSFF